MNDQPTPSGTGAAPSDRDQRLARLEMVVSRVLQVGVTLSAAIVAVGIVMFLITHQGGYPIAGFPHTISGVLSGVVQGKPYAVISLGLLVLLLTPVLRVAVSLGSFVVEQDRIYVVVTFYVLAVLIASFFLGQAGI